MVILLDKKEFRTVLNECSVWEGKYDPLLKAQALKVLDELGKPCPHVHKILPNRPKRACEECMAEISAALEGK